MPAWLKRSLIAKGTLTPEGLTRRAKVMRCRTCRTPVLAGFDSAVAALDAWCDLTDLSPLGEAMALVDRRWTYTLREAGGRMELDRRDQWAIVGSPAGSGRARTVLATHRCAEPVPAFWGLPGAAPSEVDIVIRPDGLPF
jgi:hypothetical protein